MVEASAECGAEGTQAVSILLQVDDSGASVEVPVVRPVGAAIELPAADGASQPDVAHSAETPAFPGLSASGINTAATGIESHDGMTSLAEMQRLGGQETRGRDRKAVPS